MSSMRIDIVWSPIHEERFITFGNELRLFQIENISEQTSRAQRKSAGFLLSKNTFAQLLSINSEISFIKCLSCYPKPFLPDNDILLAVGQGSGKVILTSFSSHTSATSTTAPVVSSFSNNSPNIEPRSLVGCEYIPKHARACNCIAWNPVDSHLLLTGLDKHRTDNSLFLFDIDRQFETTPSGSPVFKPIFESGSGESTFSFSWFNHQPKSFIWGINKSIKVYDLRDWYKPKQVVPTKAVHGLTIDPFYDHRIASYTDNQIFFWDSRNWDRPMMVLTEPKPIVKICWCTTRNHVLSSLTRESSAIKLHDVQHGSAADPHFEPNAIERSIEPPGDHKISSFSWHPIQELRLLYVTSSGSPKDYKFYDRVTLNWSPASEIVWTNGWKLLQCIDSRDDYYKSIEDVSVKMRERAIQDYGFNEAYIPDEPKLRSMWSWIESAKSISSLMPNLSKDDKLIGVKKILFGTANNPSGMLKKSDLNYAQWVDLPSNAKIPVYRSEERSNALALCGWGEKLDSLIDSLKAKSEFTRAAAISVFNLRIRKAIDCLISDSKSGGAPNLSTVAMALSGYTGEKNSLWREMCSSYRTELSSPYLKAIFSFLTSETETYEEILYDCTLELSDRVAFACSFLPDAGLQYFLDGYTSVLIQSGDVDGLLMTGITNEGLDLLQHYVEATSDVQTVSFVILHSLPSNHYKDPRAQLWVENYRNILDCWRLWHKRAQFDIEWFKRLDYAEVPGPQLFVNCNYCGKSVSSLHSLPYSGRSGNQMKNNMDALHTLSKANVSSAPHKARVQSCPSCRKPLPRCCICLTHFGTPAGFSWRSDEKSSSSNEPGRKKITPLSCWFSWCQTCRHGGHAKHMMDWFKEQIECPVSGCSCRCILLDTNNRFQN